MQTLVILFESVICRSLCLDCHLYVCLSWRWKGLEKKIVNVRHKVVEEVWDKEGGNNRRPGENCITGSSMICTTLLLHNRGNIPRNKVVKQK